MARNMLDLLERRRMMQAGMDPSQVMAAQGAQFATPQVEQPQPVAPPPEPSMMTEQALQEQVPVDPSQQRRQSLMERLRALLGL